MPVRRTGTTREEASGRKQQQTSGKVVGRLLEFHIIHVSVNLATKLRWFRRGAAAFELTFPGSESGFGPADVCPICDRAFSEAAVHTGVLTAEHVPPESFGGRELLLTCKKCNNEAGTLFDAHARRKEDLAELTLRPPRKPLRVRIQHQGRTLNARLSASDTTWELKVIERANDPKAVIAFQASGPPKAGEAISIDFVGSRFVELGAKMSWLRSGFLALFATFGYRFSSDPALSIVKRQLLSHESSLIYSFTIEIPQTLDWLDWRILEIREPRCTGVVFGRYVMVYPHPGDMHFYERLEVQVRSRERQLPPVTTAQSFGLVDREPRFGYDITDVNRP